MIESLPIISGELKIKASSQTDHETKLYLTLYKIAPERRKLLSTAPVTAKPELQRSKENHFTTTVGEE